ncbi:uncharacterized protein SCHCODRAFT_02543900 [Schizophyllum commune H4-8]|uniref:Fungal-type protein kinase domain-containing protein n=1 Tax=Schizophyllum commune (strain H4-8 / FGSC 9210) TaxID=578458 RepID=D8Q668_SCHCM|nr:uncharacterized protein SCHCODRAFT_02543900 [Schizophyllum commune H4-8]KAI5891080.1 hypothetical protein SCHCODRAFT_02543900 [Schizophyllum commune H4-8]
MWLKVQEKVKASMLSNVPGALDWVFRDDSEQEPLVTPEIVESFVETHFDEVEGRWRFWPTEPDVPFDPEVPSDSDVPSAPDVPPNPDTPSDNQVAASSTQAASVPSPKQPTPTPFNQQIAAFLNAFADELRVIWVTFGIDTSKLPKRVWRACAAVDENLHKDAAVDEILSKDAAFEEILPADANASPDLALWEEGKEGDWATAAAIGWTTEQAGDEEAYSPLQGIADAAGLLMGLQPARGYGLGLIASRTPGAPRYSETLQLVTFDRAGIQTAARIPIHDASSAETLVRLLTGLAFGTRRRQGWDTSRYWRDGKEYVRIRGVDWEAVARARREAGEVGVEVYVDKEGHPDGVEFEILPRSSGMPAPELHQVATACWPVRGPDGITYALRESWDEEDSRFGYKHECEIVARLGHVEGVVDVVASEVVEVDGTTHSTMIPRLGIEHTHKDFDKLPLGTRTHHRVLMFPFADDVTSVKSPLELLHVLCDAVLALQRMKAGRVMHCDISANNVRLWRPPTGRVRGMLIDLEKSCVLDEDGFVDELLMGTVVFMSLNVLESKLRTPADDLESIVYLLIYICTACDGPRGWRHPDSHAAIACWADISKEHIQHKKDLRAAEDGVIDRVVNDMTEFFADLEPLVWELLHKMAKVGAKGLKHSDLFGVLDEARQELIRKEEEEEEKERKLAEQQEKDNQVKAAIGKEDTSAAEGKENVACPVRKPAGTPARPKRPRMSSYEELYGKEHSPKRARVLGNVAQNAA